MAKIIIFSGAGISAESGISTFRDSGGLWEQYNIKDICTSGCLETNREQTIEFYDKRRANIKNKVPNNAHLKIKELQDKYPNDIKIITQNVDDLFEKAGCKEVLHLHGFLREIYCEECGYKEDIGYGKLDDAWDDCPMCHNLLRPNVVFFGEQAPKYEDMFLEMDECKMLVVIGTSGNVLNTDMFLTSKWSKSTIEYSILNNLEKSDAINDKLYSKVLYKKATEAIDEIIEDINEQVIKSNLL
jgi:NAD-dependent deacetylase